MVGSLMISASAILGGGGIWYLRSQDRPTALVSTAGNPIALSTPETTMGRSAPITSSSPVSAPSNELKVISGAPSGATSTPVPTIPGPESFAQYEQYRDKTEALFGELRLGTGAIAEVNHVVTVNYKGWLTNGNEFDESYAKGKPFIFTIGQHRVILGWEEAILGMKVGGKRRFIVPPAVGYGATGQGSIIPPNSLLVFDVELLAVQ